MVGAWEEGQAGRGGAIDLTVPPRKGQVNVNLTATLGWNGSKRHSAGLSL
jgi:hypothetical protein